VIKGTILGLFGACGVGLLGLLMLMDSSSNVIGVLLLCVGFVWGTVLLFVLSAQLLMYGLTGIAHDIGAAHDRDPWNRW